MKKSVYIVLILLLTCNQDYLYCQCASGELSFNAGEKLIYEAAYNWGYIWVNAGEVIFETDTITIDGKTYLKFDASGKTYSFYDWIYKVRDYYQSYVDPISFEPYKFYRNTAEGGYTVNNQYDFDFLNKQIISSTEHSDRPKTIDTLKLEPCVFDVLTAMYYARSINLSDLSVGEKIPLKFIIDGEFYELYLRYLGRELIENRDGKRYKCIKLSAILVEGTIFKGGEDVYVWVSDDENKIPVFAEAKILVGTVQGYLKGHEGLKYEMDSEVK